MTRHLPPHACALALLLLGGLERPALAQDADDYFQQGVEALRTGDPERATTLFEKSYALQPRAATLCNLALAYDHWDEHETLAAETYDRCAEEDRSGRFRAHARERAREIRADLAADGGAGTPDGVEAPPSESAEAPPPGTSPPPPEPAGIRAPGPAPAGPPVGWVPPPATAPPGPPPRGATILWPPPGPAVRPERSHPLLWVGLGSSVLGAGAIVAGLLTMQGVRADADYLDGEYDGGDVPIRGGSGDADLLESARGRSDFAVVLYAVGGGLAALGIGLMIADTAQDDTPAPAGARAVIVPVPGGALASVRVVVP